MREMIGKVKFFIDGVRYRRGKTFHKSVVTLLFIILAVFSVICINLKLEIKRKENILESYYYGDNVAESGPGESGAEAGGEEPDLEDSNNNPGSGEGNYSNGTGTYNGYGPQQEEEFTIKAYICGEIKNSGVYELKQGSRIIDLIDAAGGHGENAFLEIINLAQILVDGQRVYVPSGEEVSEADNQLFGESYFDYYGTETVLKVNINTAGSKELESLPGIGPSIARNIIEYREKNGLFTKKEELKKVTGIGEKKYEKIIEFISI